MAIKNEYIDTGLIGRGYRGQFKILVMKDTKNNLFTVAILGRPDSLNLVSHAELIGDPYSSYIEACEFIKQFMFNGVIDVDSMKMSIAKSKKERGVSKW